VQKSAFHYFSYLASSLELGLVSSLKQIVCKLKFIEIKMENGKK
jgi:hypothetical protein